MYTLVSVFVVIVSLLLVLIVLVQNSKGGGLASNFSSSNQVMGVRKTTDFLEKATWGLSLALLALCLLASVTMPREKVSNETLLKEKVERTMDPSTLPDFPTSAEEGADKEKEDGQ